MQKTLKPILFTLVFLATLLLMSAPVFADGDGTDVVTDVGGVDITVDTDITADTDVTVGGDNVSESTVELNESTVLETDAFNVDSIENVSLGSNDSTDIANSEEATANGITSEEGEPAEGELAGDEGLEEGEVDFNTSEFLIDGDDEGNTVTNLTIISPTSSYPETVEPGDTITITAEFKVDTTASNVKLQAYLLPEDPEEDPIFLGEETFNAPRPGGWIVDLSYERSFYVTIPGDVEAGTYTLWVGGSQPPRDAADRTGIDIQVGAVIVEVEDDDPTYYDITFDTDPDGVDADVTWSWVLGADTDSGTLNTGDPNPTLSVPEGASLTFEFEGEIIDGDTKYVFVDASEVSPYEVDGAVTITGNYDTYYKVSFDTDPAGIGAEVTYTIDGEDEDMLTTEDFIWVLDGLEVTFEFEGEIIDGDTRYVFVNASEESPYAVDGAAVTITGYYDTYYKVSFDTDPVGIGAEVNYSVVPGEIGSLTTDDFVWVPEGGNIFFTYQQTLYDEATEEAATTKYVFDYADGEGVGVSSQVRYTSMISGVDGPATVTGHYDTYYKVSFTADGLPAGVGADVDYWIDADPTVDPPSGALNTEDDPNFIWVLAGASVTYTYEFWILVGEVDYLLMYVDPDSITDLGAATLVTGYYGTLSGGEGGNTIGFWTNKNGQALIDSVAIADLNDFLGTQFNNVNDIRAALRVNAKNMDAMLQAQLIATFLNTRVGDLSADQYVWIGDTAGPYDDPELLMTIQELMDKALEVLNDPNATRAEKEYWKDILDKLNNNKLMFVG